MDVGAEALDLAHGVGVWILGDLRERVAIPGEVHVASRHAVAEPAGASIGDALGPAGAIAGRVRRLVDQEAAAVARIERATGLAGGF